MIICVAYMFSKYPPKRINKIATPAAINKLAIEVNNSAISDSPPLTPIKATSAHGGNYRPTKIFCQAFPLKILWLP